MVVEGTPAGLAAALGADVIRMRGAGDGAALAALLRDLSFVDHVTYDQEAQTLQIGVDQGTRRVAELVARAAQAEFAIEDVSVVRPGLGDVFLRHTGRALRDE
jgi:ABC-2 type transport system ATP-binding protein